MRVLHTFDRWLYPGGRPNRLARLINKIRLPARLRPKQLAYLEVRGRRTGRVILFPVVVADHEGERYLVSMLGNDANWVRNVHAARGLAVLRHGRREAVRLEDVDPAARPPILRRYLALAPGARPHMPVDRHSPIEEFEQIAPQFPVFRITTVPSGFEDAGSGMPASSAFARRAVRPDYD